MEFEAPVSINQYNAKTRKLGRSNLIGWIVLSAVVSLLSVSVAARFSTDTWEKIDANWSQGFGESAEPFGFILALIFVLWLFYWLTKWFGGKIGHWWGQAFLPIDTPVGGLIEGVSFGDHRISADDHSITMAMKYHSITIDWAAFTKANLESGLVHLHHGNGWASFFSAKAAPDGQRKFLRFAKRAIVRARKRNRS